jgi:hypothetical protein
MQASQEERESDLCSPPYSLIMSLTRIVKKQPKLPWTYGRDYLQKLYSVRMREPNVVHSFLLLMRGAITKRWHNSWLTKEEAHSSIITDLANTIKKSSRHTMVEESNLGEQPTKMLKGEQYEIKNVLNDSK